SELTARASSPQQARADVGASRRRWRDTNSPRSRSPASARRVNKKGPESEDPGHLDASVQPEGQLRSKSDPSQILAAERRRANALAGRVVDRVGDGRRRRRAGGLAQTAPLLAAGGGEDRLHMRHLVDAQKVVGVEVGVDEAAVLQLEPARPGMREFPADRAFALLG